MHKLQKFLLYIQSKKPHLKIVFYNLLDHDGYQNYILFKPISSNMYYGKNETYILLVYFDYTNDVLMLQHYNDLLQVINPDRQLLEYDSEEFLIEELSGLNFDKGKIYFNLKLKFK
jgi:hypothetical protein